MKIYINSPVFQKFLFQSTRRKTSSTITPVSQSVSVRNSNRVERPIETRSLSVQRDPKQEPTTGKFFADEDIHEKILRDIQQAHNQESIRKLEQLPASKQQYLLLAIAHRNLLQNERAKMWLLKAIKEFHCDDAYIQLGIMEMKQARYHEAIKLFDQVRTGDLYKARCLTALKLYKQAIDIYEKHDLSLNDQVRHAIAIYKNGQLESALLKIEQLLQLDSEYSEGLLTKGIILFKKKLYSEAVMVLECAVQVSNSSLTTAKSLYYMIKCRISQRDYYAAWAQLQRALILKRSFRFMAKVSSFVQGTMCLMKRQYQRGLDYLQECKTTKFLATHLPLHMAYAQFCLSDYRAALVHYEQVKDNQPTIYNSLLCKALLAKPQDALPLLDQALLIYHRMEPFIYKAIALIQLNGLQSLKAIELNIEQAFKAPGKQSNVYYIRAILKAINKRYTSAIKDIDKAVDKSEDNIPEHFFLRGILHGQAMRLKQAVKDFSTTLHFNPSFQQAYLERAKCYQILGDVTNSQQDLQKYCLGKNNDAHFWTGAILFHNNQYEEALSQIELCSGGHVLTRLKCLLKMQKIDKAVELSLQLDPGCDRSMIHFIHHTIELSQKKIPEDKAKIQLMEPITVFGEIFKEQDYRLMRGAGLIYLRKPKESIEEFQFLERFWIQVQKERQASISDKSVETEQSEELQNEMILKSERIVQHIIAIKYNLIIIYLMTKQYLTAQQKVREIRQQIGNIFSEELDYLETIISNQIEKKSSNQFPRVLSFLMNEKSIFNYFPTLRIPLMNTYFDCKLSLNLPDVQPPNICPIFDKNCLLKIKYNMIENKPEAPWLSRVKNNVIFTQNILDQTIDLTTDEDVPKKKPQPFEIDEHVQKKLERIMKKQ